MRKYNFILIFFFLFGCKENKKQIKILNVTHDSISYFLDRANRNLEKDINKSYVFYKKALKYSDEITNDSLSRDCLFKINYGFYKLKKWEDFKESSKILLEYSIESKDTFHIAQVYRYKGNYYKNTSLNDSAFYYYIKAEKLFDKINDKINLANILTNKSVVQYNTGNYNSADKTLTQSYFLLKNSEDKNKFFECLIMMGVISNETKNYEQAIEYYNKALTIVRENKIKTSIFEEATTLNNLGYNYQKIENYNEAIKNYNLALKDKELENSLPDLYSLLIDNLAYSKFKIRDFNNIPDLFYKGLRIREKINSPTLIILSKIHLSEYYFDKKDLILSKKFANEALRLSKETKNTRDVLASLKQASNVDAVNSSKLSKDYIRISDSINEVERKSQEKFARLELETEEIKEENTQLSQKNRTILNYFISAIIIGGFLFFARTQRSRSRELTLKQSQQQANEEIYRLIISHQNQLEEGRDLEKKRLSKELHDGVLGRLFGLRLNLDGLNNSDDEISKQQRLDYLNELQLIEQDLRDISHELNRENLVLINNFVAIINNLLEQQAKINPAKIKAIIADDIDWEILPNTAKINLYRILQEALQNINKHAEAKNILIHFRKDKKGNLLFNIEDDGKGYDLNSKKSKGIGMKNIVSRTQQCNGIIDIKSEIGKGSKIIITFPLENKTIKV